MAYYNNVPLVDNNGDTYYPQTKIDSVYDDNSESLATKLTNIQSDIDARRVKQDKYITTTATGEGWYRVATIPMTAIYKNTFFKVRAYTATGTCTESTIMINLAYYAGNYGSQLTSITANTSHSFNSSTNAENGRVLLYCRVSFDATNGYIDLYKYKTTAVTIECEPLVESDWIWSVGSITLNPTVGAYRNTQVTLDAGLRGNDVIANYASYSGYSQYGTLGTQTLSNTTDKTGQWEYFGNWYFEYNASWLKARSGNIRLRIQELDSSGLNLDLDDFILTLKVGLGTHTDSTTFNTTIPSISLEIDGKTSLTVNDICALTYSTSTTTKYIRLYIKLKSANALYLINPEQRYGRSFNTSNSQTTSYSYFNLVGDQTTVATLPTPAQGSIVYPTWKTTNADLIVDGVTNKVFTSAEKDKLNGVSIDANKVSSSSTNGNIKINDVETIVYTHPTGTNPHGTTKADLGLGNVDNTSDLNKPISTATQTALNGKEPTITKNTAFNPNFETSTANIKMDGTASVGTSGNVARADHVHPSDTSKVPTTRTVNGKALSADISLTSSDVGLGNVPNVTTNNQTPTYTESGTLTALTSGETTTTAFGKIAKAISTLISHIANVANPHSVTKSQVGLGNVDNTSDVNKPISTATQNALDLKAPLASPTLTGTPTAPTATTGTNTTQIATTAFVQNTVSAIGAGDMTKAVYDTNGDGIVDNSDKLDGKHASEFFYANAPKTTVDPNNAVDGVSYFNGSVNAPPFFPSDKSGTLYQRSWDSTYITQLALAFNGTSMAIRTKIGGTWTAWSKQWNDANDVGLVKHYNYTDVTTEMLNNGGYRWAYECDTVLGLTIGLPVEWWHIQYFMHTGSAGYGTQIAFPLYASQGIWIRTSNGATFNAWKSMTGRYGTTAPTSLGEGEVYYQYE